MILAAAERVHFCVKFEPSYPNVLYTHTECEENKLQLNGEYRQASKLKPDYIIKECMYVA